MFQVLERGPPSGLGSPSSCFVQLQYASGQHCSLQSILESCFLFSVNLATMSSLYPNFLPHEHPRNINILQQCLNRAWAKWFNWVSDAYKQFWRHIISHHLFRFLCCNFNFQHLYINEDVTVFSTCCTSLVVRLSRSPLMSRLSVITFTYDVSRLAAVWQE